jgi:hypothetical protein
LNNYNKKIVILIYHVIRDNRRSLVTKFISYYSSVLDYLSTVHYVSNYSRLLHSVLILYTFFSVSFEFKMKITGVFLIIQIECITVELN